MDTKGSDGHLLLLHAAEEGHEVVVKLLVARDDIKMDSKDEASHSHRCLVNVCVASAPCPLHASHPHLLALGTWSSKRGV